MLLKIDKCNNLKANILGISYIERKVEVKQKTQIVYDTDDQ